MGTATIDQMERGKKVEGWIKRVLTQARSMRQHVGDVVLRASYLFGSQHFTLAFIRVEGLCVLAPLEDGPQGLGGLSGSGVVPG